MRIGWIGLGNMGAPMAGNLARAGHDVLGFDVTESARSAAAGRGVSIVASVGNVVTDADVVFTMLPTGALVRSVLLDEAVQAAKPGTLFVDSSTTEIQTAHDLHDAVGTAGHRFVDAPVSGGVNGAEAGTLTFMAGGAYEEVDFVGQVAEPMAGRIFHTGGPGTGQAAKIVNNMMAAVNLAGVCEGAVLAERLGLDATIMHEIASVSSGDSWVLRTWYPVKGVVETAPVNRNFEGGFAVDLFVKDLGIALEAGTETKTPLAHARLVHESLTSLSAAGHGRRDSTQLVQTVDGTLKAGEIRE